MTTNRKTVEFFNRLSFLGVINSQSRKRNSRCGFAVRSAGDHDDNTALSIAMMTTSQEAVRLPVQSYTVGLKKSCSKSTIIQRSSRTQDASTPLTVEV